MTTFKQLINPHQHSDASIDGASKVSSIVKRSKELGATYVTMTEHGNMNSAMQLYKECKEHSVKPILGVELYIEPPHLEYLRRLYMAAWDEYCKTVKNPQPKSEWVDKSLRKEYVHLTIHFKDEWAWNYFCKLSPIMEERAIVKWGERKPLCTMEELRGASGHIVICSGCMIGAVQKWLIGFRSLAKWGDGIFGATVSQELAERAYLELRDIAGKDDFFVEVFPHKLTHDWVAPKYDERGKQVEGSGVFKPNECTPALPDGDLQRMCNRYVVDLARKHGDKILISLDSHFATADQKIIQDAKLGNGDEKWKFFNSYHIMSTAECAEVLKDTLAISDREIEQWVDNSYYFGSKFDDFKLKTSKDRWLLQPIEGDFMAKLKVAIDRYGRMDWNNPEMVDRLKKEIRVLAFNGKFNLISYFFTVEDIANFCREAGILMNVRGSAGGSLLLHVLGVSAVNPLRHNLSFERFLTEGRIKANTLPDVDMDVSDQDAVFAYLTKKYGDGFCRISTDQLLRLKSSIKDAERFLRGSVSPQTEAVTKALPTTPQGVEDNEFVFGREVDGVHVPGVFDTNETLRAWAAKNPDIWACVSEMLGIQRNKGTHACGVIIADKPVQEYMPVISMGGIRLTGFSPKSVEAIGGVKYDLLGLNTLRDIQGCLKSIKSRLGITLDPWNLPFEPKVVQSFARGETASVFQFDTATIRPYVVKVVKPENIHNLVDFIECMSALTSLGRPGTLDAPYGDGRTLAEVYVARANGEPIEYIHQDLEPIMKVTLGIQLYQEQTLQIFRDIGGFTYEEAEVVRRGIGKKDEKVLASSTGRLREACLARGWTNDQVDLVIEQIMASARYSFNKSHAVSYAYVAYACLYLREMYKLDWWKSVLDNAPRDKVVSKFWKHVSEFVDMPSINNTSNNYQIIGERIVAPMSVVSGLGEKMFEAVVTKAPYSNFSHFMEVHFTPKEGGDRSPLTRPVIRKMITSGLMDPLFSREETLMSKLAMFEREYARVRGEKPPEVELGPKAEMFMELNDVRKYLVRKQMVSIFSEDLRPMMLAKRGGKLVNKDLGTWMIQDAPPEGFGNPSWHFVIDGDLLEKMKKACEDEQISEKQHGAIFKAIGYVVDEKAFPYKNKSKTANKMVLDVGGYFYEQMLWPPKDETKALMGYKGLIVILTYQITPKELRLKEIKPLISKQEIVDLNVLFSDRVMV